MVPARVSRVGGGGGGGLGRGRTMVGARVKARRRWGHQARPQQACPDMAQAHVPFQDPCPGNGAGTQLYCPFRVWFRRACNIVGARLLWMYLKESGGGAPHHCRGRPPGPGLRLRRCRGMPLGGVFEGVGGACTNVGAGALERGHAGDREGETCNSEKAQ